MAMSTDEVHKDARKKAEPITEKFNGAAKGQGSKAAAVAKGQSNDGIGSIKKHKVQQAHDMPGPDGSKIRQAKAGAAVEKDKSDYDRKWGAKYAKMDIGNNKEKSQTQDKSKSSGKGQGM